MNDSPAMLNEKPIEDSMLAFPASVTQQVFWYMEVLQGEVSANNVPLRFRLLGPLQPALLEKTLQAIIDRHEALRTSFTEDAGELLQLVHPTMQIHLPVIDLSHLNPEKQAAEIDQLGSNEAKKPFQLGHAPLVRCELLRLSAESHVLHFTAHHAIFDGFSMTILTQEIAAIYQQLFDKKEIELEPLAIQYGDYSIWQKEFLESESIQRQLSYWKDKLQGMIEVPLPTEFPRPKVKSWRGEIISRLMPKALTDRLHQIAADHGATLFQLQLAAYQLLLKRYSECDDIAVGTPVAGRLKNEIEPLIGVFINSVILRSNLAGNPPFSQVLENVRDTALEALENQELPFECLVRELKPNRDPGRNPLFQINFNHHRSFAKPGLFGGVSLEPMPSRSPGCLFDLHFFMVERKEGWRASCDFSLDLFSRETAEQMLEHYIQLLEHIAFSPDCPIEDLNYLSKEQIKLLENRLAGQKNTYPEGATIPELFREIANQFPDHLAIKDQGRDWSYRHVEQASDALAAALYAKGVRSQSNVAMITSRSAEMIVVQLACLKLGACCVPLDAKYPLPRLTFLLEETQPTAILVTVDTAEVVPGNWCSKIVEISDHLFKQAQEPILLPSPPPMSAGDAAFIMFTSGSTGKPKGVIIPHRGVIRLVRNNGFLTIQANDVFLQAAPATFDACLLEIWGPLLNGGRLVVAPESYTLEQLATSIVEEKVTILWLTSGLFQAMIDEHLEALSGVASLLSGGEVLSQMHVRKAMNHLPNTQIINGYGPTENTTFTTCHSIQPTDLERSSIPIGKPIANTTTYLLDSQLRLVPHWIPGELYTGGDGLAIGYLNAPDLTAEKFINHPRYGRLYRTGDICRRFQDGSIEFLGRKDHQVKVRGHRIELGEIETLLSEHTDVAQAKVLVRGEHADEKRVIAWVTLANHGITSEALMKSLAAQLPAYMQPSAIHIIDHMPLNANGKIDANALPEPKLGTQSQSQKERSTPSTPHEKHLATIWCDLLDLKEVYREDDFFLLGGHSLMALRMFSRINRELGKNLPLRSLFENSTLSALAALLNESMPDSESDEKQTSNLVTLRDGDPSRTLVCVHGGDGGILFYREFANLISQGWRVMAIESEELRLSSAIQAKSIEETAARYVEQLLKAQPSGPYHLAGYSFGGVVVHEMACQLRDTGAKVAFVGLFDTANPQSTMRSYGLLERLSVFWDDQTAAPFLNKASLLTQRIKDGLNTRKRVRDERMKAEEHGPAEAYSDLRRVQIREENWRAMLNYQPRVLDGHITLFKAKVADDKFKREEDYGWTTYANAGLSIVSVPGDHLTMFDGQHIPELSKSFNYSLLMSI